MSHSGGDCSDRYNSLPLSRLHKPFSPSLISRTVSVDVKHHVYLLYHHCLLLLQWCRQQTPVATRLAVNRPRQPAQVPPTLVSSCTSRSRRAKSDADLCAVRSSDRRPVQVHCCFTSTDIIRTGAQDGHLHFHTAPEFCRRLFFFECCLMFSDVG